MKRLEELKAEFGDKRGRYYMGDDKTGLRYEELPDEHKDTVDLMLDKYGDQIRHMGRDGEYNLDNDYDLKVDTQGIAHVNSPSTGVRGTINVNRAEKTGRDKLIRSMESKYGTSV